MTCVRVQTWLFSYTIASQRRTAIDTMLLTYLLDSWSMGMQFCYFQCIVSHVDDLTDMQAYNILCPDDLSSFW